MFYLGWVAEGNAFGYPAFWIDLVINPTWLNSQGKKR
jgi:hypothetical protein